MKTVAFVFSLVLTFAVIRSQKWGPANLESDEIITRKPIKKQEVVRGPNDGKPGSTEGCLLNEKTERLQIAFVCDQTYTNIDVIKLLGERIQSIMDSLNTIHKDTEFALTTHANYEANTYIDPATVGKSFSSTQHRHNDVEGCYTVDQVFTTNTSKLSSAAAAVKEKTSAVKKNRKYDYENSIPALAMTTADTGLGWVPGDIDPTGRNIHKILILVSDTFSYFDVLFPGNRKKFKGDGTDTCSLSLPPTEDQAAALLKKHGIGVIGAYVKMEPENVELYTKYFDKYNIPYQAGNFGSITQLSKDIVGFITEAVKKQLLCVFRDPPSYNTLGL